MSSQFRLFSSQYAKAVHPRTKNDQKVVEGSETNGAMAPADVKIESTHDHDCFEKGDDNRPVKMLKQKALNPRIGYISQRMQLAA